MEPMNLSSTTSLARWYQIRQWRIKG